MINVMVRHDAKVRLTVKCSLHGPKCEDTVIPVSNLDAHLTLVSFMHGKVSGYDSGVTVKANYKLVNPKWAILKNGQLCPCDECKENN